MELLRISSVTNMNCIFFFLTKSGGRGMLGIIGESIEKGEIKVGLDFRGTNQPFFLK